MSLLLFVLFAPAPFTQPVTVHLGVDFVPGATDLRIATVFTSSPAHKAGLWSDDVILDLDGTKVQKPADLLALLRKKKPGDVVSVALLRQGRNVQVRVKLGTRPGY